MNKIARIYFYFLAGLISALLGWSIAQLINVDWEFLEQRPEVVFFPCIAVSLAGGTVINEVLLSNPTRLTLALRKLWQPLLVALGVGGILGGVSGGIYQIFLQINIPTWLVRCLGWIIIGLSVGLSEGLSWFWQTIEAKNTKRFKKRLLTSVISSTLASLVAAILFELIRSFLESTDPEALAGLRNTEDLVGFSILGIVLGLTFALTNSPSYIAALRAGTGFEYTGNDPIIDQKKTVPLLPTYPTIKNEKLKLLPGYDEEEDNEEIEVGLSIQLPDQGNIFIGSEHNPKADIKLPGVPLLVAWIQIKGTESHLKPTSDKRFYEKIAYNGQRLDSRRIITLKHNDTIAFYTDNEKMYRFVYYNRFLDPQG